MGLRNGSGRYLTGIERGLLRLEDGILGPLGPEMRHNMRIEIGWAVAYGAFSTALAFVSVVLRQLGAPAGWIAFYNSSSYLGSVASWAGLALFATGRVKTRMTVLWLVGRSMLVLMAAASGYPGLLVLAAIFWLLEGLPGPAYTAIIQRVYPVAGRGRVISIVRMAMSLPMLALGPVAGWLLDSAGYRVLFPLAGLVAIAGTAIFSRLRVDESTVEVRGSRAPSSLGHLVARDRRFALYLAGVLFFGLGNLMPIAIVPIVQVDTLHLSYTVIGWLNLSMAVTRTLSYAIWGRMSDRWGGVRCMQIAFGINVVALAPYAIAALEGMGHAGGWILLPAFIASGIVGSAVDLGFVTAIIQLAPTGRISEYAAAQAALVGARGMLGPFIGVGLMALGMSQSSIFVLGIGLTLLAVLALAPIHVVGEEESAAGA